MGEDIEDRARSFPPLLRALDEMFGLETSRFCLCRREGKIRTLLVDGRATGSMAVDLRDGPAGSGADGRTRGGHTGKDKMKGEEGERWGSTPVGSSSWAVPLYRYEIHGISL